jgi:hypothetical protein
MPVGWAVAHGLSGVCPRPEGCSRARRRRTGAGRTGSGGGGTCASQRRVASRRATLLPPLGMSPSVMSSASGRMPGCGRFWMPNLWPPMAAADSLDTVSCETRRSPPAPGAASRGFAAARAPVTPCHTGLRVRQVRCDARSVSARPGIFGQPAADRALADGPVLACHAVHDHAHGHPALAGGPVLSLPNRRWM